MWVCGIWTPFLRFALKHLIWWASTQHRSLLTWMRSRIPSHGDFPSENVGPFSGNFTLLVIGHGSHDPWLLSSTAEEEGWREGWGDTTLQLEFLMWRWMNLLLSIFIYVDECMPMWIYAVWWSDTFWPLRILQPDHLGFSFPFSCCYSEIITALYFYRNINQKGRFWFTSDSGSWCWPQEESLSMESAARPFKAKGSGTLKPATVIIFWCQSAQWLL